MVAQIQFKILQQLKKKDLCQRIEDFAADNKKDLCQRIDDFAKERIRISIRELKILEQKKTDLCQRKILELR